MEGRPVIENNMVYLNMYGKDRWVFIEWLKYFAHFEINLPEGYRDDLSNVEFLDTPKKVSNSQSGKIVQFKYPIRVFEKYRLVPGFTHLAVSIDGVLIDIKTNLVINTKSKGSHSYPHVNVYHPDKSRISHVNKHRLVALTWCPNKDFVTRCIINHINGNKKDFHARNLEWVSYSENAIHAFKNQLRDDNKECKVKDHHTGEVHKFYSLRTASEFMGFPPLINSELITFIRGNLS